MSEDKRPVFKFKIETTVEIDIHKYFDDVPEGLFKASDEEVGEYYATEAVHKVVSDAYTYQVTNHMNWMTKDCYSHAEHHLKISEEIAKQISNNVKIELIEPKK